MELSKFNAIKSELGISKIKSERMDTLLKFLMELHEKDASKDTYNVIGVIKDILFDVYYHLNIAYEISNRNKIPEITEE